jgi:hypothetical protein
MNDDLMFEYLLSMGAMTPEEEELKRKQAMVEALRQDAMAPMEGKMVSGHYVGPNIATAAAKLGQSYMASKQQKGVDQSMRGFNDKQRQMLEDLKRRRAMQGGGAAMPATGSGDPYGNLPTYGSVT